MPSDSSNLFVFDASVVERLACPACLGGLSLAPNGLLCAACHRAYPIVDGIPMLIAGHVKESKSSK